ncbi:gamma carbonic anhydrase family protein [Desulfosporosinus nitroreducens]|uniref:Gamma carbonic anhydrase family protein n=1 Tax=Desulfosporosinus nitroreducens TaxID=2018668 RepID=A0ABT8QPK8_9FIRM|nr:gamma carbonic anhydrase family protein [Desulfosporosinus nitroreducens]MCO1602157.1 gamma carbonic anhydrase family protein [Desulfosporosinus nitroreducens]MDO0823284.1 gamma carbonic anhydrase family protein [Desulfosporosinus nitroreducens]
MIYAFDGHTPEIGTGTYVSETAIVIGNVKIGENCYIGHGAILRGDYGRIEIGSETAVEEGVIIHIRPEGLSKIGNRVTFGHGAIIHSDNIADWAVIGMGAIVSLGAKVGAKSIVAEGSVVKQNQVIPENVVVAGNPAKVVRELEDKDIKMWTWGKQVYVDLAAKYLKIGMQRIPD